MQHQANKKRWRRFLVQQVVVRLLVAVGGMAPPFQPRLDGASDQTHYRRDTRLKLTCCSSNFAVTILWSLAAWLGPRLGARLPIGKSGLAMLLLAHTKAYGLAMVALEPGKVIFAVARSLAQER